MDLKTKSFIFLAIISIVVLSQTSTARNSRRRNNTTEGGRRRNRNRTETFRCPVMACNPVPLTCQDVEYIVTKFRGKDTQGRITVFECRGCDYCNDVELRHFQKRDASREAKNSTRTECLDAECPTMFPPDCRDVQFVDNRVNGSLCGVCAVCFDGNN